MRGEFLASTDERFRPVNLSLAPDGTLYVVDMYRGIIEHKGYTTEYLRDYILKHKLDQPDSYGRIYRIVHDSTQRDLTPLSAKAPSTQLIQLLSTPMAGVAPWRSGCSSSAMTIGRPGASEAGARRHRRSCAHSALWTSTHSTRSTRYRDTGTRTPEQRRSLSALRLRGGWSLNRTIAFR